MTDPHNPAAQNPSGGDAVPATPPAPPAYGEYATPPAAPAYGEYAPTAPAAPPAPDANAYQQPAYAQAPAYAPGAPAPGAAVPGKTLGIVAFVLSFFVQLIALILGIVALVQSKKAGRSNGFALAAIIISAVLMVIGAILAAIFIPIFIESINAATVCANDPNATVEVFGQQLSCQQLLEQSGR